jgi:ACS family pantothenate transporter-like MFS transporter
MLAAWHMDATGTRIPMAILAVVLQLTAAAMLVVPTLSFAGTFFAFYLSGTAYMVLPLIFGWANIILQRSGDDAVRSVTLFCMNVGSTVLYTFWGVVLYSAADAPYWKKGSIAMIVCCFVMLAYMWLVWKVGPEHSLPPARPGGPTPAALVAYADSVPAAGQGHIGEIWRPPPRRPGGACFSLYAGDKGGWRPRQKIGGAGP